jgi:hypothetical protein
MLQTASLSEARRGGPPPLGLAVCSAESQTPAVEEQKPRPNAGRPEPPTRDRGGFAVEVDEVTLAAIVTENGTNAMQFTRIASEVGVANAVFLDLDAALKWIREARPSASEV